MEIRPDFGPIDDVLLAALIILVNSDVVIIHAEVTDGADVAERCVERLASPPIEQGWKVRYAPEMKTFIAIPWRTGVRTV